MRKRLFLLFFPMMFIPAVAVMVAGWQTSERHLAVLNGPGLHRSLDSSLELARLVLRQQEGLAQQWADSLAADPAARLSAGFAGPLGTAERRVSWVWPSAGIDSSLDPARLFPGLIAGERPVPVRTTLAGRAFMLAAAPLANSTSHWFVVASPLPAPLAAVLDEVIQGTSGIRQLQHYYGRLLRSNALLTLGVMTVLLLGLSLWLSTFLSRRVVAPLRELVAGTEKVAGGDLDHVVAVSAPAELGLLVGAFNRMTRQLLAGQRELRRAERIAAWQGVARRLAHEIKNPLTPITLAMHRISRKSDDPTVIECVDAVLEEAANLERLANDFALYAKLPAPDRRPLDRAQLQELVSGVARLYLARTSVRHQWEGWQTEFQLLADAGQLRQVVSNLVKNGVEAMAGEGVLTFGLETLTRPDPSGEGDGAGRIALSIGDTGPGLPADAERIFEPNVTSKPIGTGLGLAIARRIVNDHDGRLVAVTTPAGAVFTIELPTTG